MRLENSCCWARSAFGQRVDVVELAQEPLELGAVADGDHGAELASARRDRHPVDDQHVLVGQHDLVVPAAARR